MSAEASARPLRLFYIGPYNSPHLEDLAVAMRQRGHVVQASGELWGGLPASSLPEHGVPVSEIAFPYVLSFRRILREFEPDVVHAHWMPFATLAMLAGARPLVAQAWGSDVYLAGRRHRFEMWATLRRTAVTMADSADLLERLTRLGPKSLKTMLVNWGVDLEAVVMPADAERAALKNKLGLGPGPVILSPRGLKEIYNPEVVMAAFARVRAAVPDAQLVLKHGGADELPEVAQPGVKPVGRVEAEEMVDLFRAAEVTVSIPRSDSSPRSVWEAMAAGSATVLSDLPWAHELIEDGRHALLAPASADAVAAAIERLLADPGLRASIAAEGRALVERTRDRNAELSRVEACYRDLVRA
ncbi:MAG TPA: glycosyltransferase family 4 protein [Gaiellaceae bacterium]|nr:glycosyltransferase family 4 protein [Gaiellaceae bacterium]